jgi:hypothetical protein
MIVLYPDWKIINLLPSLHSTDGRKKKYSVFLSNEKEILSLGGELEMEPD